MVAILSCGSSFLCLSLQGPVFFPCPWMWATYCWTGIHCPSTNQWFHPLPQRLPKEVPLLTSYLLSTQWSTSSGPSSFSSSDSRFGRICRRTCTLSSSNPSFSCRAYTGLAGLSCKVDGVAASGCRVDGMFVCMFSWSCRVSSRWEGDYDTVLLSEF